MIIISSVQPNGMETLCIIVSISFYSTFSHNVVCVCVCACVRACVRACVCVYYVNYLFTLAELELSCSMESLSAVIKYLEVSVL